MARKAAPPKHGLQRTAFEVTFASDARLALPKNAALVALCRLLSDQLDQSGGEATNRLTAAYLSALKDIDRALGVKTPAGGAAGGNGNGGALGRLQGIAGGKAS